MFLFGTSVVTWPVLVVLRIVRLVSATTIRELWKGKVYHSHVLEGTRYMLGDTVMSWMKEREFGSVQFTQSCPSLWDPRDCSTPGFLVHHQLPELTQTHVHWVSSAIQPSHPLSSPSSHAFNLSQHQNLSQWVSSSPQVTKVLEFQLQHQSFQWIFRTDFL